MARPECASDRCWSPIACEANGFCRTERFENNPGREARLRGLAQIQTALLAASDLYESWLRDHADHPSGNWQRMTWHLLGEALRYPVVAEQIGGAPESPASKSHIFQPVAILTIHRASEMTPKGRRAVADWLRMHADMLVKDGKQYMPRFVGRYMRKAR